jgi:hypothetical protein
MHRIVLLRIGGKKLHLLKLVGSFTLFGAALGSLDALSQVFLRAEQISIAQANPEFAINVLGITTARLVGERGTGFILGFLMQPLAAFMFWLALFLVGAMVYRTGGFIVPIEEDIETVQEKPKKKGKK